MFIGVHSWFPSARADTNTPGIPHAVAPSPDGLRELVTVMFAERDRRYEEKFTAQQTAVAAALTAQKEATAAAFASSERAISKAEQAQTAYNTVHNDLSRKMDQQYKEMIPLVMAEDKFKGVSEKIDELKKEISALKEFRSSSAAQQLQNDANRNQNNWIIGLTVTIVLASVSGLAFLLRKK